ncbi:unnamed protein product [Cylindrotheca closterium]|uniref:Uncharacterized protein n=1 Tax=Cylindrotheca closterium TaxID=2856 RepID=A0AAD2FPI9_9STRA|nr:unnamed protein product [Cylindrotheca closterium]
MVAPYYISITGFTLKSIIYLPKFMSYSIPAEKQAAAAEGNLFTETTYIDGILHTLTAWKDKQSMRKYMLSGAHAKALKVSREIGEYSYGTKTYGYEAETIPNWKEARQIWEEKGTLHGKPIPTKAPTCKTTQHSKILFGGNLYVKILVACSAWFLLTKMKI